MAIRRTRSANSAWLCHKHSAFLAFVNLGFRNCPHVPSTGRTWSELSQFRINIGQMICFEGKPSGKLPTKMRQRDHSEPRREAGSPGPTRHPLTRAQTNRLYLQTRIRRPRTTKRFECGDRENAQTTRARSEPHHIARTGSLMFFSPAPPNTLTAVTGAPPQNQDTVAG